MKKLGVVLQYELMTYIKNKSYVISTVVIAVIAAAIMFVPRFIDISAITGITNSTEQNSGDSDSDKDNVDGKSDSDKDNKADNNKDVILIYDESGTFSDIQIIQAAFDDMKVDIHCLGSGSSGNSYMIYDDVGPYLLISCLRTVLQAILSNSFCQGENLLLYEGL